MFKYQVPEYSFDKMRFFFGEMVLKKSFTMLEDVTSLCIFQVERNIQYEDMLLLVKT